MTSDIPPLPSPAQFAGRTALVTGGSDGLGLHLVESLVSLGSTVWFCGREAAKGRAVAERLGERARFEAVDLADTDASDRWINSVAAGAGASVDFLINNAATDPRIDFEHATPQDFDRLIAINLRPFFTVTHACLPLLRRGAGKSIVNLITTNYMLGLSPFTLYNASKSGIVGFTRSLARELGPDGIRVNAVSPGWIMTEKQLREHVSEKDKVDLLAAQSMKFLLGPQHVTPLTLFLLSAASMGITGQNIVVDGGKVMQ